jgi:hypothetical protein
MYPCTMGHFCNQSGLTSPVVCPAGFYCNSFGLTKVSGECSPGTFCLPGSTSPQLCPIGSICPTPGMKSPLPCLPGQLCPDNGQTGTAGFCGLGNYSLSGATACSMCPRGLFNNIPGMLISVSSCKGA